MPDSRNWELSKLLLIVHLCSNETISGLAVFKRTTNMKGNLVFADVFQLVVDMFFSYFSSLRTLRLR